MYMYYKIGSDGRWDSLLGGVFFGFARGNIMGQADITLDGADKKGCQMPTWSSITATVLLTLLLLRCRCCTAQPWQEVFAPTIMRVCELVRIGFDVLQ